MAFDAFLKIAEIKGDSTDAAHPDEITLLSFSFGVSNSGSASMGGGAGAGKAVLQDFGFAAALGPAAPALFLACASGRHFPEAQLSVRSPGGEAAPDYYQVKLTDVLVSSLAEGGTASSDSPMMSQVTLNFAKIEIAFTAQDPKGAPGATTTGSWDQRSQTAG